MMLLLALLLQTASTQSPPAQSPPPPPPLHGGPQKMVCPVGGESFSAWQPTMYSTYGERPDGKPYSYLPLPFPVPECPTNKLLLFDSFSAEEVTALTGIIATPDYVRLIDTDTTYYRAYWLATRLGRPKSQSLGLLLSAIWQVSPGAMTPPSTTNTDAQLRRYQALFVGEVQKLAATSDLKDQTWLLARAANAARQMGQFREAQQLLDRAEQSLAGISDKRGWDGYVAKLRIVIARRDVNIEPLDMIPAQEVASACTRRDHPNAFDRGICSQPAIAAQIAKMR